MRVDRMTPGFVEEISNAIAGQLDGQSAKGLLLCEAGKIRSLRDSDLVQQLCVLEDPVINDPHLPDNLGHALAISSKERTSDEILEIQSDLYDLFGGAITELEAVHAG